jgi:hypothetical protein
MTTPNGFHVANGTALDDFFHFFEERRLSQIVANVQ